MNFIKNKNKAGRLIKIPAILLFVITLANQSIVLPQNKTQQKLMKDGEHRVVLGINIYCRQKYYYFSYDLINDENFIPEIYQPLEHHIFGIKHYYVKEIREIIESDEFIKKAGDIYTEYKNKMNLLLFDHKEKIIRALNMNSRGLISSSVFNLNQSYENLINKLNNALFKELIEKNLNKSIAVTIFPEFITGKVKHTRSVLERFSSVNYTTPGTKKMSFREPDLIDLVKENIEIFNEWSKGFSDLKLRSGSLSTAEQSLKKSMTSSKISSEIYNLEKISHNWLASINKIDQDYRNYMINFNGLEEFLSKKIKEFDKLSENKNMNIFEDDEDTAERKKKEKEAAEKTKKEKKSSPNAYGSGGSDNKQYMDSEDREEEREKNSRIKTIYEELKKINSELIKIQQNKPNFFLVHQAMIKFRSDIDVKEEEANEYIKQKKEKQWRDNLKNWWKQFDSISSDAFKFTKFYDEKRHEWKKR